MVDFVKDEHAEGVADALHVDVGRIVGRDGDRLQIVSAAADDAAMDAEGCFEVEVPLGDEIERRRDDEGRSPFAGHGQLCDEAFSGASWEYHHAASAVLFPGLERFALIIKGDALELEFEIDIDVSAGLVVEWNLGARQVGEHAAVGYGRPAKGMDARVIDELGQDFGSLRIGFWGNLDDEGSGVEGD